MPLAGTKRRKYYGREDEKGSKSVDLSKKKKDKEDSPEEQLAQKFGGSRQLETIKIGTARSKGNSGTGQYRSSFGRTRRTGGGTKSFGSGGDTRSRARSFGQPRDTGGGKKAFKMKKL